MDLISGTQLWLGNRGDLRDPSCLRDIRAVVDLAIDEPAITLDRERIVVRIPLMDGPGNEPGVLRAAIETVAALIRSDIPTLVVCSAGLSRTPAIAAAALALATDVSLAEGLTRVRTTRRSDISPAIWDSIQRLQFGGGERSATQHEPGRNGGSAG